MKNGLYSRLAVNSIRNNKKIYFPYILTCTAMVMIFYIVTFLARDKVVKSIPGGGNLQQLLGLGMFIVAIFATIFLLYTSSFIMKRRKKEFGVYNILGMGKKHIARVIIIENTIVSAISIVCGLVCGIVFSKLAQLVLLRAMHAKADYSWNIDVNTAISAFGIFIVIFALILLRSLTSVGISKPIDLLNGSNSGEKAPKTNWVIAVLGILCLAAGYFMAVSVKNAMDAFTLFFIAVIFVILGTYFTFIAGSVAVLKILKGNKKYYYKTSHFVSTSGMAYRMKRNGAGLASICILSTIVLVMISSVTCLYVGSGDAINKRYERDIMLETHGDNAAFNDSVNNVLDSATDKLSLRKFNVVKYDMFSAFGLLDGNKVALNKYNSESASDLSKIIMIRLISLKDYNRQCNKNVTLNEDECLIMSKKTNYDNDSITIGNKFTLNIVGGASEIVLDGNSAASVYSSVMLVVKDNSVMQKLYDTEFKEIDIKENLFSNMYCFDLSGTDSEKVSVYNNADTIITKNYVDKGHIIIMECKQAEKDTFMSLYSGLFFLGIILGAMFILAAVLIMYYKQVTEGYEDRSRFEIMQKVGMTDKEIKKSINSQILTVFFMPLIVAGIHLAFAFPMVQKLLLLFNLTNVTLFFVVTGISFVVFAVFYTIVYFITSRSYYQIVKK